jgi:predicted nucleic acid-binding protein
MTAEARVFLDTNLLVYAFDDADPAKKARAIERFEALSRAGRAVLSTQVLAEFYVTVTRKLAVPLPESVAEDVVRHLARLPVVATDAALVQDAVARCRRLRISLWDALIVAAAVSSGCGTLLSEDLQDNAVLDGVRVENPFRVGREVVLA